MTEQPPQASPQPGGGPTPDPTPEPSRGPTQDPTPAPPPQAGPPRSPRRGMCAAILSLEAVTLGLTTPVMITIAGVPVGTALAIGLGLTLACLLLAGMLRREWAYSAGWVVQGAAVGLGFVVPLMFFLGAVFAALWAAANVLGRKIERERAAAYAALAAERPGPAPEAS